MLPSAPPAAGDFDTLLVVDAYLRTSDAPDRVDAVREAGDLQRFAHALARRPRLLAIAETHDPHACDAYAAAGFTVAMLNGNRAQELPAIVAQEEAAFRRARARRLIMITGDASFAPLARQAEACAAEVIVWWSGALPAELTQPGYIVRDLEQEVLGLTARPPAVTIFIDYENIHIGLERQGVVPTPGAILAAVRAESQDLGVTRAMHCYADWKVLSESLGRDVQRELVLLGAKTHYQIGRHGKNVADMAIMADVYDCLAQPVSAAKRTDAVVLVTGDRDFVPLVEHIQQCGKPVRVLTLRACLSQELRERAPDLRELDQRLAPHEPGAVDAALLATLLHTVAYLRQHRYAWAYVDKLAGVVAPGQDAAVGRQRVQVAQMQGALAAGPASHAATLMLNPAHPAAFTAAWLYDQLYTCLVRRAMPYVDTSYLSRCMGEDQHLRARQIGQSWEAARQLLTQAAASGVIVKHTRPHPADAARRIDTWRLAAPDASLLPRAA